MDFKRTFNSTTFYGRRNVAVATLGTLASFIMYKKLSGSNKVNYVLLHNLFICDVNLVCYLISGTCILNDLKYLWSQ